MKSRTPINGFLTVCTLVALQFGFSATLAQAQHPDTLRHSILPPPTGAQIGAQLGSSVAVDGEYTVAGVPFDDSGRKDSGAVKVFDSETGALLHVLTNPTPAADDQFGSSVAISGKLVVVGAFKDDTAATDAGIAYVYDLEGETPTVPVMTLNNPSPNVVDNFGCSVSISGTRVVIGAYQDDAGATNAGSAYIYDLEGDTPTVPVTTLHNPTPVVNDYFGYSVSISGTRVVVGAHQDDTGATNAGSAYVYDLESGTPAVPVATLNNPDAAANDNFGYSVSISGTRVVVGAYQDDSGVPTVSNAGIAYVYDLESGTPMEPVATLSNPSPAADDNFGYSVSISGTRVVVGAYQDDMGATNTGSAYVYDLESGTPESPIATLNHPAPTGYEYFGYSVSISGTRVVAGAYQDDTGATNAGSAYVYDLDGETPESPIATLNHPGPGGGDRFGDAVAVSGTRLIVGAPNEDTGASDAGSAYVYDLASGAPVLVATLNNPYPAADDNFGYSVSISGTRVVVGAYGDDTGASSAGSAYVYDLAGGTPVLVATLNNPDPEANDLFGNSVSISGTLVVVGAVYDNAEAADAGSAYVYDLESETPTVPIATLNNPNPAASDYFGHSVSISGTRVVVGAHWDDAGATDAGSAYVYDLAGGTPVLVATLHNPDPTSADYFGNSVSISGTRVVVGAFWNNTSEFDAGSAYVYDLESETPTVPIATLDNPGPKDSDHFGSSVAISGTLVLVGASDDDPGSTNAGSVYVYDLESETPTVPVATLNSPSPTPEANLGWAVAIDGTTAVLGAPVDDALVAGKGAVYVFRPSSVAPSVLTQAATDVTLSSATLRGTVNPEGQDTTYFFEYRLAGDTGPKTSAPANTDVLEGGTPLPVSVAISGLLSNTEYEFWLTATNSEGSVTAGPESFTTLADTIDPVITARLYAIDPGKRSGGGTRLPVPGDRGGQRGSGFVRADSSTRDDSHGRGSPHHADGCRCCREHGFDELHGYRAVSSHGADLHRQVREGWRGPECW